MTGKELDDLLGSHGLVIGPTRRMPARDDGESHEITLVTPPLADSLHACR